MAPAYLPQGVTVRRLYTSIYDNDASSNVTVNLHRVDNFSGAHTLMAAVSTSGANPNIVTPGDQTICCASIEYPTYAYYLTTCLNSADTRLYSVRIYYESNVYLPLITR
jgi:hypothetical protein